VERCRSSCEYFGLCGGGAGSNKYWEHGSFDCSITQHCRYRIQLVADVVVDGMERELGLEAPAAGSGSGGAGRPAIWPAALDQDSAGC
jgi:uncharacterized protein